MTIGLAEAQQALDRGDYGRCLRLLDPLASTHPISEPEGAMIRMLMVTAWMGQGEERRAISTCRLLTRCKDPDLRNRAKQLLNVLEAPSLERPARWSMQLPSLEMTPRMGQRPRISRRRRQPTPPPPPPTGPTQGPSAGFAAVVLVVLVGLTLLLGGCMQIRADLDLVGPDRLEMSWHINSLSGRTLPWQSNFQAAVRDQEPNWTQTFLRDGELNLTSRPLNAETAARLMADTVERAGRSAGLSLPPPDLSMHERNWLIGVQQNLTLNLDLTEIVSLPNDSLSVTIGPSTDLRHVSSVPIPARLEEQRILWPLAQGEVNHLELHRWQWSRLGLGGLAILGLLLVSTLLQAIRQSLGFGYPQLPS
ncbi:DUF3153 domain-containing protein [Synechococcus sp. PROS-7-1]|uniref:DUF3153 domain-containing protein n=1 Tax=Synechococcus sp. PROS-7-1 TaxID=1442556 RepID=UPI001645167F|nr:DUF3153 domain-containing protein [Synechococcus sp. PROS-7-1]